MGEEGGKRVKDLALPKSRFDKFYDRFLTISALIAGGIAVLQLITVFLSVFFRFFLGISIIWIEDVASLLIVWIGFLISGWILMSEGYVTMDFFYARLKGRTKAVAAILISLIGLVCCAIIFWFGLTVTIRNYIGGYYKMGVLRIKNWPVLLAIPIGSFFMLIQWLRRTRDWARRFRLATVEEKAAIEARMEEEEKV